MVVFCHSLREQKELLVKCAATALSSKLVATQKDFFAKMVVDAVMSLDDLLPLNMIGMKKVQGGGIEVKYVVWPVRYSMGGTFEVCHRKCLLRFLVGVWLLR